jgi:Nickel responsive protein SCO4226-like
VQTYMILRRQAWPSPLDADEACERTDVAAEGVSDSVSRIRSYVLEELDGSIGSVCIYRAASPEAIRRHSAAAELPIDEIVRVIDTTVVRPDPDPVSGRTWKGERT